MRNDPNNYNKINHFYKEATYLTKFVLKFQRSIPDERHTARRSFPGTAKNVRFLIPTAGIIV